MILTIVEQIGEIAANFDCSMTGHAQSHWMDHFVGPHELLRCQGHGASLPSQMFFPIDGVSYRMADFDTDCYFYQRNGLGC